MSEFESEREQLANILKIILRIRAAKAGGKEHYSADEIIGFLLDYAAEIKQQ